MIRPLNKAIFTVLLAYTPTLAAAEADAPAILQQKCAQCHGASSGMSGLKINSRDNLLKGGSRGPALVPGHSADSLLYKAVAHIGDVAMPPGGSLPSDEIAAIKTWIDAGATWTAGAVSANPANTWWAFRKPVRPAVPADPASRNPIDAFIDRKLAAAGIPKSPAADRLTLLRRASYDLLGLPPTQAETDLFLNDKSPDAWEHEIDRLLASPRYGEKWGRHWLDLARYGDTAGFEQDPYLLIAWRYRDYVIKSFNEDKPYDRFIREQIAGDELYPNDPEARTGTGLYRVGPNRDMLFKVEDINLVEKRIDMVDTTGGVFLGLTIGCARCHDHKFDPIPQRDYYRMQAIFQPAVANNIFLDYNPARQYDLAENGRTFKLWQTSEEIQGILSKYQKDLREKKMATLPLDAQAAFKVPEEQRNKEQRDLVTENESKIRVSPAEVNGLMDQADKERMDAISKRLLQTFASYAPPPMTPGIVDIGRDAPRTFIAIRGNPDAPGDEVQPGFLSALGGADVPEAPLHATSTGRRTALAEFIASPDNPLTARVMVNRIWQFHFGSGLVKTPSDFGTRSGTPNHPELLDWLATEFVARKWSIKSMNKLIMMSDAYQRGSNPTPAAREKDPENDLISHMNRRRLEAEELRDASFEVTGELNLKMGGLPVVPPLSREEMFGMIGGQGSWSVTPDPAEHKRRTVYMIVKRTFQQPMAQSFDGPDGILSCPRRNESTTAPQSLELLNSAFTMDRAKALAEKAKTPDEAWRAIYGRQPTAEEKTAADEFLTKQPMTELIRALMNTNEFLYVD